jgi:hypothetical protein
VLHRRTRTHAEFFFIALISAMLFLTTRALQPRRAMERLIIVKYNEMLTLLRIGNYEQLFSPIVSEIGASPRLPPATSCRAHTASHRNRTSSNLRSSVALSNSSRASPAASSR